MPELFGQVEQDLLQHGLIPDLDEAMASRTWHFIVAAVHRLLDIDTSWTRKAVVEHVRSRQPDLPHPVRREGGSAG